MTSRGIRRALRAAVPCTLAIASLIAVVEAHAAVGQPVVLHRSADRVLFAPTVAGPLVAWLSARSAPKECQRTLLSGVEHLSLPAVADGNAAVLRRDGDREQLLLVPLMDASAPSVPSSP